MTEALNDESRPREPAPSDGDRGVGVDPSVSDGSVDDERPSGNALALRGDDAAIQRMRDAEQSGEFNVLYPAIRLGDLADAEEVRRLYVVGVSSVKVRTDPVYGEIYHDPRYAKREEGKAALTARGLNKLASAAGVEWDLDRTGVVDRTYKDNGHVAIHYRAVGRVRTPAGGWHEEIGERLLDTEVVEDLLVAREQKRDSKVTEDQAKTKVRLELLSIKERALERAETQAKNRVLRRLFNVPQVFTRDELVKPFLVPFLVYRPALGAGDQGRRAASAAFGSKADVVEPEASEAGAAPSGNPSEPEPTEQGSGSDLSSSGDDKAEGPSPEVIPGVDEPVDGELVEEDSAPGVSGETERPAAELPRDDPKVVEGPFLGYRFSALGKTPEGRAWLLEHEAESGASYRRALAEKWAQIGAAE